MNKEIIELILNTDKLTQEQKAEILKELIKHHSYPIYNPPFNEPNTIPNWNGPSITPCPIISPLYHGTEITCEQESINITSWFDDVTKGINKINHG